ncbi:MAG TPA: hypothetical protein VF692_10040 [Pyrinomonadaceae bacterium]
MQNESIQINLSSISSQFSGKLDFTFIASNDGSVHLRIYAFDPKDLRKSGIHLMLSDSKYQSFKDIVTNIDETIKKLKQSGKIHKMLATYSKSKSVSIDFGSINSYSGQISFSVITFSNKNGHLQIFAHDPSDLRKSGVLLHCSQSEFDKLRNVIKRTDELLVSKQVKKLTSGL